MIFALGQPGQPVRCYFESDDADRVAMQLQADEVAVPVDAVRQWATIDIAGESVTIVGEPTSFSQDSIRARRSAMLASCDWTVLPDSPLSPAERAQWVAYRQALRDITDDQPAATLETVVWPSEPGAN